MAKKGTILWQNYSLVITTKGNVTTSTPRTTLQFPSVNIAITKRSTRHPLLIVPDMKRTLTKYYNI
jgi:hypothetical protein